MFSISPYAAIILTAVIAVIFVVFIRKELS